MTWEDDVLAILADGYNVHYGARSIKHEVSAVLLLRMDWLDANNFSFYPMNCQIFLE